MERMSTTASTFNFTLGGFWMIKKKIPMRQCTGCGEMKTKKELIRVIKTPENEIAIDFTGKKNEVQSCS